MKILLLLRHAKSSWDNPDLADFERPLNSEGLSEAIVIGKLIFDNQIRPDAIFSSPAQRARQTAELVTETARIETEIRYEEKVYEASPFALLQILTETEDATKTLLLIGHNPGLEGLIKLLTGETRSMPTAGLAKLDLQIENWSGAAANCGQLEKLWSPKDEIKISSAG